MRHSSCAYTSYTHTHTRFTSDNDRAKTEEEKKKQKKKFNKTESCKWLTWNVVCVRRIYPRIDEHHILFIFCSLSSLWSVDSREYVYRFVRNFIIFIVSGCIYVMSMGNYARLVHTTISLRLGCGCVRRQNYAVLLPKHDVHFNNGTLCYVISPSIGYSVRPSSTWDLCIDLFPLN